MHCRTTPEKQRARLEQCVWSNLWIMSITNVLMKLALKTWTQKRVNPIKSQGEHILTLLIMSEILRSWTHSLLPPPLFWLNP